MEGLIWPIGENSGVLLRGAVLVASARCSGLIISARLMMLGVESLVIDRSERTGDNWRRRYKCLVLNAMPHLGYFASWPVYTSKDKMGDFLEVSSWVELFCFMIE